MASPNIRKLCTDIEHTLLQSAAAKAIMKHDAAKLQATLKKVEAIAIRLKAQAKKAMKSKAAAAKLKARAFEDAARRLRARLAKVERAAVARLKSAKKSAKRATKTARPAKAPSAKKPARGRGSRAAALSGASAAAKNPLTHRGTRVSRTQLLLEHQGLPVEVGAGGAAPSLAANGSNLNELIRETEVRNRTLKLRSARARGKSVENLLAASANARIRGHASGAGRRAQGRSDAALRGEKRPGSVD